MSRGDDFPRYTYMMDFMDEDTPLRDYWQTTDDLNNEDAATLASLATQVLQSKSGYEYGEGIEVNEPALVANYMYSESRSPPQSQYSTAMPTEPAESFRGLMEDHDRGAQTLEESAASEYDFEPETRGHVSNDVDGTEESSALSREHYAPELFRPMLNVTAEVEVTDQNSYTHEIEMSAAMTASRVVNGVLSRSYAGTPTEEAVNLQALQSQAPQPTPPQSESRSVSVETSDCAEQEKEPTMDADEQHVDEEPETALTTEDEREEIEIDEGERVEDEKEEMEGGEGEKMGKDEKDEGEPSPDTGAQQQLMMESDERRTVHDDERLPLLQQTPRKRGRPRRSGAVEAPSALTTERPTTPQIAVREKDSHAGNEVVESAATGGADLSRAGEMPTERKRGRPRKSEISEPTAATAPRPAKRGPGRPPKSTALELNLEATPAVGKSGRSRRSSMIGAARMTEIALELSAIARELSALETLNATPALGKRGRPRRNSMIDAARLSAITLELSAPETSTSTPALGKRGRPRKSDLMDAVQISTGSGQLPVVGSAETGVPSGKRGRPRKSDVLDAARTSISEVQETPATVARASSKRGRPRKSDTTGAAQASNEVLEPPAVGALIAATPALSKRERPPKRNATQSSTEESQLSSVETPATTTPAASKRGRPRKSDTTDAMPAQVSTHEAQLPAVEAPIITTLASGERGLLPKASITISTTTPVKRGRPPKSAKPTLQREIEILPSEDATQSVDSPAVKFTGRRGRPPLQTDTSERRAVSPTPLSTKKRGRGRPPRNETLLPMDLPSTTAEPGLGMDAQETERREPSNLMADVSKDLAVGKTDSTLAQGNMEATPARKRGRPKAAAADKPLSVVDMLVTASAKKRGRPLKAVATIDSEEEHGRPFQSEAQEEEEEPAAKRRRTNNDTTMEDAVDEDETRGAQEDELPSVEELRDVIATNGTTRKRSSVTWAQPLSSTMTEPKTAAEPYPQLDRRPRLSGEMLEQSTRTKQVEQPPTAPKPKTPFDMISDGRRMVRQKTYGKRSKR